MYIVYKHTNKINNKVYIGITSKKPEYRWNNGKNYPGNEHFSRAINKYGWENFNHEILFSDLTEEEAKQKEIELIAEYDSTNEKNGYNISKGGNIPSDALCKKVNCYDLNGKFIKSFNSISDAENCLELKNSHIAECCSGKFRRVGEYTFRFTSYEFPENKDIDFHYVENIKDINFYDLNGTYLFTVHGIRKASRKTGIHSFNIIECCEGRHNIAGNYTVRYLSENFPVNKNIDFNYNKIKEQIITKMKIARNKREKCEPHRKEILQFDLDGNFINEWNSVSEAAREIKGAQHAGSCANGNRKSAGGFTWKWKD